jgi:hypothetical protein
MSLLNNGKSDVKNHFSSHRNGRPFLLVPAPEADATGYSGSAEDTAKSNESDTAADPGSHSVASKPAILTSVPDREDASPVSAAPRPPQP